MELEKRVSHLKSVSSQYLPRAGCDSCENDLFYLLSHFYWSLGDKKDAACGGCG